MTAELAFHFMERVDELMARGSSVDDAWRKARQLFGDVGRVRGGLADIDRGRVHRDRRVEWWSAVLSLASRAMGVDPMEALRGE